ncbi:MAG TPA: DNA polymerase [Candidatus Hydrogenedentes bacterium]|nr:DNA polymerase [Candidatus Hydrogenedentota bacterium]
MYPHVTRGVDGFIPREPWVSIDFEFNSLGPTIVGLSSGGNPASGYYTAAAREVLARLERGGVVWVGHNILTADKPLIEAELGVKIPLERCEDSMILHYLCNAELCKGVSKTTDDEDEEDNRGQGYMDLWSMASLYTDLPQWKQCRGERCEGPCRRHDELGYNGLDALAVDIAYPRLIADLKAKKIPRALVEHTKKLALLCDAMTKQGIKVDRELVRKLEAEFEERKGKIFPNRWVTVLGKKGKPLKNPKLIWDAPFNPRSPKQVVEWFQSKGIHLESTEREDIQRALDNTPEDAEGREWLERLFEYKSAGKGLKPWTDERYFDNDGLIHPRFIVTGTSTGRLASSSPNFQNLPRGVSWGKGVRRAIIPRAPDFILAKADFSQLELRVCLWYSGVKEELPGDAFNWLVQEGGGVFEKAAEIVGAGRTPRDLAKSVSHGGDYLEGVKVFYPRDLSNPRVKKMIDYGALVIHKDWEYHGGVVGFTGVNLAERLFGSATWENRKKALQIQEAYFKRFAPIREWQKKLSRAAERGWVQLASGRYLLLLGTPEDKLKIAAAAHGQGSGSDYVQEAMIKYYGMGFVPLIQIHDELVFELPRGTSDKALLDHFSIMSEESKYMPGFRCPTKVGRGENWIDMVEVKRSG